MNQIAAFTLSTAEWMTPVVKGDGNHILACPRYPVAKLGALIPAKYIEALEHNQKIASCCRHPENHDIEAWFSCEAEAAKGVPDIYILHCTCGRKHRRLCVGGNNPATGKKDIRPYWEVR